MSAPWTPVQSCTLPASEQPLRVAEFDDLFAHLHSVESPSETRARLLLSGGEELIGRARSLAERETACCTFFAFDITCLDSGLVSLGIEVPPAYAAVLAALVARAEKIGRQP